jgi:hypothetical protein
MTREELFYELEEGSIWDLAFASSPCSLFRRAKDLPILNDKEVLNETDICTLMNKVISCLNYKVPEGFVNHKRYTLCGCLYLLKKLNYDFVPVCIHIMSLNRKDLDMVPEFCELLLNSK